jgi:hypothetical protein
LGKKVVTFERYRYGKRSYLYPGDRFRASGGPYYAGTAEDGQRVRIPMNEVGVYRFVRYRECGASKWIEAYREGQGMAVIYVGRTRWSPNVDGLRLRPHRVRFVSNRKRRNCPIAEGPTLLQKKLF